MTLLTAEDFISRVDPDSLPLINEGENEGEIDQAKVLLALEEAAGIIVSHLPFLVPGEDGVLTPPDHLATALKSCQKDVAFYRLTDRVSSTEDDRARYKDSMKLLEKFSQQEQEGLEGPGHQQASIVTSDSEGTDGRFFKKGFMV